MTSSSSLGSDVSCLSERRDLLIFIKSGASIVSSKELSEAVNDFRWPLIVSTVYWSLWGSLEDRRLSVSEEVVNLLLLLLAVVFRLSQVRLESAEYLSGGESGREVTLNSDALLPENFATSNEDCLCCWGSVADVRLCHVKSLSRLILLRFN